MTQPRIEARITVQERLMQSLQVRIEEIAQDMQASFSQAAQYNEQEEARINAIETNVTAIQQYVTEIPTKADMLAMESRILDAFKQMIAVMRTQSTDS